MKNVDKPISSRYHCLMHKKGMALIEIVVGMLILGVFSLAVSATVVLVNSKQMRTSSGSSLDLQALNYARQTLETLKNAVSDDATRAAPLSVGTHNAGNDSDTTRTTLPASDLLNAGGTREYTVSSDVYSAADLTDLKKVIVTVTWND